MRRSLLLSFLVSTVVFARDVRVTTEPELRAAIGVALPGDVIILANGTYAIGSKLSCSRPADQRPAAVQRPMLVLSR